MVITSFVYTFPFEGNWNFFVSIIPGIPFVLWIHLPVWRELKPLALPVTATLMSALDTPSRLKGIETIIKRDFSLFNFHYFGYTFPFEGNWNSSSSFFVGFAGSFGYTFPFEGNWNCTPVRLLLLSPSLWIHLPVWRELKLSISLLGKFSYRFGYTFPFEGNWNKFRTLYPPYARQLWIHLPVWRELKRAVRSVKSFIIFLWIHLPVWRELKLCLNMQQNLTISALDTPSRLKGIETGCIPSEAKGFRVTLDTPSRLKGIETSPSARTMFGNQRIFGYTFPFEGNWNV